MCFSEVTTVGFLVISGEACNFTKSSTRWWVFFTLFELYKCYQITQSITHFIAIRGILRPCEASMMNFFCKNNDIEKLWVEYFDNCVEIVL